MKEILALLTVVAGFLGWLVQRRSEIKIGIFNDAVKALILFEVDATNQKLQKENYRIGGLQRIYPFLRDETYALTMRSIGLLNAFFSQETSRAFDNAINSVSLKKGKENNPITIGMYSTEDRKNIINALSKELSISFIVREWLSNLIKYNH